MNAIQRDKCFVRRMVRAGCVESVGIVRARRMESTEPPHECPACQRMAQTFARAGVRRLLRAAVEVQERTHCRLSPTRRPRDRPARRRPVNASRHRKARLPLPCGGGWRPLQGKPMNAQSQQLTKKVPDNFPAMLERFKGEIARALPRHLDGDRMARIALTSFRSNPRLSKCEPRSVFASIIIASQLGLEPGVMGQCYLIP